MRTTFGWQKSLLLVAAVAAVACGGSPPDPDDPGQTVHSSPPPDQGSMVDPGAPADPPAPTPPKNIKPPAPMGAAVYGHFQVEDYAKWKAVFDANTNQRVAAGETWSIVGHLMEDQNMIVVRAGFKDAESAVAFVNSPALQKAAKMSGVKGAPTLWVADNWAMRMPTDDLIGKRTFMMVSAFDISDYDAWKKKFDAMEDERKQNGEFAYIIGRALDNRNKVIVTMALTGDMPSADAIMGTHEAKDAMHECGAKGEADVWFAQTDEVYWRGNSPVVVVQLKVKNFDKWKAAFDEHKKARADAGVVWHQVARNKNNVLVTLDGKDLDKLKAFASSDDLKATMKKAGVKGKPTMWWAKEVEGVDHSVVAKGAVTSFVIKHEVSDFDAWKKAYDAHRSERIAAGVIGDRVHRGVDNPNIVVVTGFASDARKLDKFFKGKGLKKAMKAAGVKGKPTIWTGTKVEQQAYAGH